MAIDWGEVFSAFGRAVGAGMTTYGTLLHEKAVSEREEQEWKERQEVAQKLEKDRMELQHRYDKKLRQLEGVINMKNAQKLNEHRFMLDNYGLETTREYTKIASMPDGPQKSEALAKMENAFNMMAMAKGGETEFSQEQLEQLPMDLRSNFTALILANKRREQEFNAEMQGLQALVEQRKASAQRDVAMSDYYKQGGRYDGMQFQENYRQAISRLTAIRNDENVLNYKRLLMEGHTRDEIAKMHPTLAMYVDALGPEIESIKIEAYQNGLAAGMSPEELEPYLPNKYKQDKEEFSGDEAKPKKKEKELGFDWMATPKLIGKAIEKTAPARALEKAIAPHRSREKEVDRALAVGLRKARKKHGNSVLTYEQAMDLKDKGPKMAEGHMFIAIDPKTRKAATFEFIIKEGRLAIKRVD